MMVTKQGRYNNVLINEYHNNINAFSKSDIVLLSKSYAHYLSEHENPKDDTPSMVFGSAFHCLVLEPNIFEKEFYVLKQKVDKRSKAGKAAFEKIIEEAGDRKIIKSDEYETLNVMAEKVLEHPTAGPLLTGGHAEDTFIWKDDYTGLMCKCRPDYLNGDGTIVDLKTTTDASYNGFKKQVYNFFYYVQAAHYMNGVSEVLKLNKRRFVFIAVEKEPPYEVALYELTEDFITKGKLFIKNTLAKAKTAIDNPEHHKGYDTSIKKIGTFDCGNIH